MGKTKQKFKRRAIKAHEDFLKNPHYRTKAETNIKVRRREQEKQEAEQEIRNYVQDSLK